MKTIKLSFKGGKFGIVEDHEGEVVPHVYSNRLNAIHQWSEQTALAESYSKEVIDSTVITLINAGVAFIKNAH